MSAMRQQLRVIAWVLLAGMFLSPAVAARAATLEPSLGVPNGYEWWFGKWQVQQQVWSLAEGAGVTVGVLDSGVQADVPDLRGVVLPGGDMTGAGDNGQTDFASGPGHGTGVAALIAGQGYGPGLVGLAPKSRILPVTVAVGTASPLNTPELVAQGIRFAVEHGARVINMSLGYDATSAEACDGDLQNAVAYALEHDVVLIAGAGDTNVEAGPQEPAACAGVLGVGGVDPNGSLWQYSTRESYVAIAAPAGQVVWTGKDAKLYVGSGTSAASALVSAAAALIRSRYPSMPWYEVDQRLIATAIPEGSPFPNDGYGYGILDLPRAVNASAYPVSASASNTVYAKYQAWLSSPSGRAYAAQSGVAVTASAQPAPATPHAVAAHSGSVAKTAVGVMLAVIFFAALGLVLLRSRSSRKVLRGPAERTVRGADPFKE
jgi:membrane-anchored mycosin MYCP